jgi:AcrR family transcriptional regulator
MPVRAPRTQQQRRDETRRALLDAAVESLIEVGFARTTTLEVQRRADVSRGALLHHFPSKAELLVAAVDHLAEMRAKELKVLASQLPPSDRRERTDAVLGLLWQCFSGTFFQVAMELRTAARTDPELRPVLAVAEKSLRERILLQARTLFGKDVAEHPGLERALDLTLQLMIGAAMSAVLHTEDRRLDLLIDDWKALFPAVLSHAAATTKAKPSGKAKVTR